MLIGQGKFLHLLAIDPPDMMHPRGFSLSIHVCRLAQQARKLEVNLKMVGALRVKSGILRFEELNFSDNYVGDEGVHACDMSHNLNSLKGSIY